MIKQGDTKTLYLYRKLLKLYPVSYRHEYEDEMIDTMRLMLNGANNTHEKLDLFWRACKDYLASLVQQNILVIESAASETPAYVRQSSKFSTSMVLPFFAICSYNLLNQYVLHHHIPYAHLEAKTWVVYCIIMPAIATLVVALALAKSLIDNVRSRRRPIPEWVLLGLPLSLLVALLFA